jgi:hypothetical protein
MQFEFTKSFDYTLRSKRTGRAQKMITYPVGKTTVTQEVAELAEAGGYGKPTKIEGTAATTGTPKETAR